MIFKTSKIVILISVMILFAVLMVYCIGQSENPSTTKYVFSTKETVRYRFPTHINDLVMDRADAKTSEVFIVVLEPGGAPPLHKHDDTEQIFYVLEGTGTLVIGKDSRTFRVNPGDVVRIPPTEWHQIIADDIMKYLSIDCFVEGRPEAEPTWESHVKVLCQEQGWDFSKVKETKNQ
jgi:mannose-6-phosphate isomerase-like protein (cupin superfamily)